MFTVTIFLSKTIYLRESSCQHVKLARNKKAAGRDRVWAKISPKIDSSRATIMSRVSLTSLGTGVDRGMDGRGTSSSLPVILYLALPTGTSRKQSPNEEARIGGDKEIANFITRFDIPEIPASNRYVTWIR